jgi:hypothetical protein
MEKSEFVRARITPRDLEILQGLAQQTGQTISGVVRALIRSATVALKPSPVVGPLFADQIQREEGAGDERL